MKRPITVLVALGLMGLQCLAPLLSAYFTTFNTPPNFGSIMTFGWWVATGLVVTELVWMYLIFSGKDWGRMLYAGLRIAAALYVFAVWPFIYTGPLFPLRSLEIVYWISLAGTAMIIALLFLPQSNAWFWANERSRALSRPQRPPKGRWDVRRWWIALLIVLILFVGYVAISAPPYGGSMFVFSALIYGPFIVLACVILLGALIWKEVRRGRTRELRWILVQISAGLLVSITLIFAPIPRQSVATRAVWLIRLAYSRNELLRLVQGKSPPLATITLGGFVDMATGIAYDPTGQILLPAGKRSASWTKEANQTDMGTQEVEVHHIIGPYYWWLSE